ncbi:MAG: hypothetical protein DMF97_01655 [Acidobacteria bacterium]|nr:MAG: hypothetical protein DMF97_01655 [Acidobacteriota bacterium]PYR18272.1 MAG: hypothetical protein DMF98_25855 [Acidobacteriota bacterium]
MLAAVAAILVGAGVAFAVQQAYEACACIVRRADAVDDAEEERYERTAVFAAVDAGTVAATVVTTFNHAPRPVRRAPSAGCTS